MTNNSKMPITVTAHSGCENTKENSIESVKTAFLSGADITEVDIRYDKNGVPVLSHDEPKGNETTLEEAFSVIEKKNNLRVNLDIKDTSHLENIPPLAEKYSLTDRIFYTGIFEKDIPTVKEKTPDVPYLLNMQIAPKKAQTEEYLCSVAETIKRCGATGLNAHYKNVTKKLVDFLHNEELSVSLWTVNKKFSMRRILRLSPDNITTKKPSELLKIINRSECHDKT